MDIQIVLSAHISVQGNQQSMNPQPPEQPESTQEAEVGHSGQLPDNMKEIPIRASDITPREHAGQDGEKLTTPNNTAAFTETEEDTSSNTASRFTRRQKMTVSIIGGLMAVGIGTGISLAIGGDNNTPAKGIEHINPIVPTEKPTPTPTSTVEVTSGPSVEQLIAANKIKANQEPKPLAENILNVYSSWCKYGSDNIARDFDVEIGKTGDGSDAAMAAFIEPIAKKAVSIYASALYGPNYATNIDVQDDIAHTVAVNKSDLLYVLITSADKKPYTRSLDLNESPIKSTPTSISGGYTETDNTGKGNHLPAADTINGVQGTFNLSYRVVGDTIEIQKASFKPI